VQGYLLGRPAAIESFDDLTGHFAAPRTPSKPAALTA
jgi:hypothetical protein